MRISSAATAALAFVALAALPLAAQVCRTDIPESSSAWTASGAVATNTDTGLEVARCPIGQDWSSTTCTGVPTLLTWSQALQAASAAGNGWRLPNAKELDIVLDRRCMSPSVDTTVFPGATSDRFWSSTPGWVVDQGEGTVIGSQTASTPYAVRLVRAGFSNASFQRPIAASGAVCRTDIPGDLNVADWTTGTNVTSGDMMTDTITGLVWQRCALGQTWNGNSCSGASNTYTWSQALVAARAAGNGWRLPNAKELDAMLDRRCASPAVNPTLFPGAQNGKAWTSTPGWAVDLTDGAVLGSQNALDANSVRLVKSGLSNASFERPIAASGAVCRSDIPGDLNVADWTVGTNVTSGDMMTDTITGLVWQRCALGQTWNGSTCSGAGGTFTWAQALQAAKNAGAGWRLPIAKELDAMLDRRCASPAVNPTLFPGAQNGKAWTSTPGWVVDLTDGAVLGSQVATDTNAVRLVKLGASHAGFERRIATAGAVCRTDIPGDLDVANWTPGANGTITDGITGLVWQRCALGQSWNGSTCAGGAGAYTWAQALQAASNAGAGWRLPNAKELDAMLDRRCASPAVNPTLFPGAQNGKAWTSTPGWAVDLTDGAVLGSQNAADANAVRLVSAGYILPPVPGALLAIEPSAGWLQVGESTVIVPEPREAVPQSCVSSNPSVVAVSGTTLSAVGRGNVTITCDGVSTALKVRTPWVTAISPSTAVVGERTVFTVTGYDIKDSDISLSLSNCEGIGAAYLEWWSLFPAFSLFGDIGLQTKKFVCTPNALGLQGLRAEPPTAENRPGNNFADRRLRVGGFGGCAEFAACSVSVVASNATLVPKDNALQVEDAARAAGIVDLATGSVNWGALTEAQLTEYQSQLRNRGIAVNLPASWSARRTADLVALSDRRDTAMSEMFGKAAVNGYTWRDAWRPSLYSGWISTTFNAYSGRDWLQFSGGIVIKGAQAVADATGSGAAIGSVLRGQKLGRQALKALKGIKSLNSVTQIAAFAKKLNQAERLANLLDLAGAGWTAWTFEERADIEIAMTELEIVGAEGLSTFLQTGLGWNDQLADIASQFTSAVVLRAPLEAVKAELTGQEIKSIALVLADAAVGALPVIGAWKDMAELSTAIADRAYGRYFESAEELSKQIADQQAKVVMRYQRENLARIYNDATILSGSANTLQPPPSIPAELPQTWADPGFFTGVHNVIAISHGWNASAFDWPRRLLARVCTQIGGVVVNAISSTTPLLSGVADYCVAGATIAFTYNWKSQAEIFESAGGAFVRLPSGALSEAQHLGTTLGLQMHTLGARVTNLHTIGHSAGAGFAEDFSAQVKSLNPSSVRHQTFLDAYCPNPRSCKYGTAGTFAEQYFHTGIDLVTGAALTLAPPFIGMPEVLLAAYTADTTGVKLANAYNFDISRLHVATTMIDSHAFPYHAYLRSAGDATAVAPLLTQMGAPASREYNGPLWPLGAFDFSAAGYEFPKGATCVVDENNLTSRGGRTAQGECRSWALPPPPPAEILSTPIFKKYLPTCEVFNAPAGQLRIQSCAAATTSASLKPITPLTSTSVSVSSTSVELELLVSANAISFDYTFGAGTPIGTTAQIFVNDMPVVIVSPQSANAGSGRVHRAEFATVGRGQNQLQVVLRYPTGSSASLALSNIVFAAAEAPACGLDFNGDGVVDTNDALLFNRWLVGFRNEALVSGMVPIPSGATTSAFAAAVTSRMMISLAHDFDQDNGVFAATDGLLFTRLTQGLRDAHLTNRAIGNGAQRNTYELIRSHLNSACGTSYP
jgi:hypothetical protein